MGLNRLPAPDSVIIYNHRAGTSTMAYADAYEIYVNCANTAFTFTGKVTGTVTGIYASGDSSARPAVDANTVVISARGDSIPLVEGKYTVGDSIEISCPVRGGRWSEAVQVMSGFFYIRNHGMDAGQPNNASQYPCPLVGIKTDGTLLLMTCTTQSDAAYHGARQNDLLALAKELDIYTMFMLDGGGSTQMLTYDDGNYLRRCCASDGVNSIRGVACSLMVVYEGVDATGVNKERNGISLLSAQEQKFAAVVNQVNDVGTDGTPNTNFSSVLASYTGHLTSAPMPIALKDQTLSINGWFVSTGGQTNEIKWSVDGGATWAGTCSVAEWKAGTADHVTVAGAFGVLGADVDNAIFMGAVADLSAYAGQTVNVTFGRTASWGDTVVFATVTGVNVPELWIDPPEIETQAPTETETEPAVSETEPAVSETEPAVSESEPAVSETEPAATESEPAVSETEPAASETEPAVSETEPAVSETEPAVSETEPAVSESEPAATESEPAVSETEPAVSETEPAATESEPDAPVETQPKPEESKPTDNSEAKDEGKGGCGSSLTLGAISVVISIAAGAVLVNRKNKE